MHKELEQMIEHTRQTVPGLQRIEITLAERYDMGGEPGISIEAYTSRLFVPGEKIRGDWGRWKVTTFPPEVCEHFALMLRHGADHAG
jgi:hypothetical protein